MLLPLLLFVVFSSPQGNRKSPITPSAPARSAQINKVKISAPLSEKALVPALLTNLKRGSQSIHKFFGSDFIKPVTVEVFADRTTFDDCLKRRMDIPQPQRWMVAAGVADRLVLLSPRVWATEAVEHDPHDSRHVREIITHELVHVYHGQRNPRPNFENMDDLGWFVEGLAVYVAGQLNGAHKDDARQAIVEGVAPKKLADAWSGKYRYGVCGSMVQFIDSRYGRKALRQMLTAVTNDQALAPLHLTESRFLAEWQQFVKNKTLHQPLGKQTMPPSPPAKRARR